MINLGKGKGDMMHLRFITSVGVCVQLTIIVITEEIP